MAAVGRLWDYSGGIAQIDAEIEEKLNFRICSTTISLLASSYDMSNMRCFLLVAWKNSMMPF